MMRVLVLLLVVLFGVAWWALLIGAGMGVDDATFYAVMSSLALFVALYGISKVSRR